MALRRVSAAVVCCGSTLAAGLYIGTSSLAKISIIHGDIITLDRRLSSYLYGYDQQDYVSNEQLSRPPRRTWGLRADHFREQRLLPRLARSLDTSGHTYAVRRLCGLRGLPDHEVTVLAQACNYQTLVSLARCRGVDPRYFSLASSGSTASGGHGSLTKAMVMLLQGMDEVNSSDACARHFASILLVKIAMLTQSGRERLQHDYVDLTEPDHDDSHDLPLTQVLLNWFFRVLSLQVSDPALRQKLVQLGGLQLMQRILHMHPNEEGLKVAVAEVVSSLALEGNLREAIVQSGMLALLAKWLRSDDSLLSSKAATALCNLDHAGSASAAEELYEPGVCLLHPTFADAQLANVDVVFVHGLRGGPGKTWRQNDAAESAGHCDCWPKKWLAVDCPNVRVLATEYETMLTEWVAASYCPHDKHKRTIDERAQDMLVKLQHAGLGSRPIVWVGHSLGGLLVERMLLHASSGQDGCASPVLANTKAVVLCSVPHRGAALAGLIQHARYLLYPATEVQELRPGSGKLEELRQSFAALAQTADFQVVNFHETQKTKLGRGLGVLLVPGETEDVMPDTRVKHFFLDEDHLGTCKPHNKASPLYSTVVDLVTSASKA